MNPSLAARRPRPGAHPVELFGRLLLSLGAMALVFGLFGPGASQAAETAPFQGPLFHQPSAWFLCGLRCLVLAVGALAALWIQAARPPRLLLLATALACWSGLVFSMAQARGRPSAPLSLLHLELALLSAVSMGTSLGRSILTPGQLLAALLCAAAGDAWLCQARLLEAAEPGHPLRLLNLPWPPPSGPLGLVPTLTDLMFLSAFLEGGRRLEYPPTAMAAGGLLAYALAAALSLLAGHPLPALPLLGLGLLWGAWRRFRCRVWEVLQAFGLAFALYAILYALTYSPRPPPAAPQEPPNPRWTA